MKKLFVNILFYLLLFQNGYSQSSRFNLEGKLSSKINGTIYLSYFNDTGKFITDSTFLQDSIFNLSGNISGATSARINIINGGVRIPFTEPYNRIFLEPADLHLNINVQMPDSLNIIGSKTQTEYSKHLQWNKPLFDSIFIIEGLLAGAPEKKKKYYMDLIAIYNNKIKKNNVSFINRYPNSFVSSYLLYNLIGQIPMEEIKKLFKILHLSYEEFYFKQTFYQLKEYENASVEKTVK
ncbi:MAG: hypothetical protein JWO92_500 [Chitinophagaceae bacterium]|nr:hypothetical protein [Chitinophagaceae bacterium]